ncbi:hypothetical protein OF83DRAFT_1086530 [Amylostereum chailletii]|nr:hypothetical protein OF83DRAFT_1086530 [Amylostereum chailletii]
MDTAHVIAPRKRSASFGQLRALRWYFMYVAGDFEQSSFRVGSSGQILRTYRPWHYTFHRTSIPTQSPCGFLVRQAVSNATSCYAKGSSFIGTWVHLVCHSGPALSSQRLCQCQRLQLARPSEAIISYSGGGWRGSNKPSGGAPGDESSVLSALRQARAPPFTGRLTYTQFEGLNGWAISYPRDHVLGGSTTSNQIAYCRGSKNDYDRWANVTGDPGRAWNSIQPSFRKVGSIKLLGLDVKLVAIHQLERFTPPADGRNVTGKIDLAFHGQTGMPFALTPRKYPFSCSPRTSHCFSISSGYELPINSRPEEVPFDLDFNFGDPIGIGYGSSYLHTWSRSRKESGYLPPLRICIVPTLNRSNLDILVNTRVTKIFQMGTQSSIPIMRGVRFSQSVSDTIHALNATKEVVLSAGATNAPPILMLSGIGDAAQLAALNITTSVASPDVGQNLQDHAFLGSSWTFISTDTLDNLQHNATLAAHVLEEWKTDRTGPLVLTASRLQPVRQRLRLPENAWSPVRSNFFSIFTNVMISPTSHGNITLASANPFDPQLINPDLLGSTLDISTVREALNAARRFVAGPAWADWIADELGDFAATQTDAEIEKPARNNADLVVHVVGTVGMGSKDTLGRGMGALNPDLTVKGTVGLRVVDASVFVGIFPRPYVCVELTTRQPFITSGHTRAPVYVVAERAADLIKGAVLAYFQPVKQNGIYFGR